MQPAPAPVAALPQQNMLKGFLYALGSVAVVSTNYITAKHGLKGFNYQTFSTVWTTAAAVYALLIVLGTGQWKHTRVPRRVGRSVAMVGVMTAATMLFCWAGLQLLDASFAAFIYRLRPVLIILLSAVFLNERLTKGELAAMGVMLVGGCYMTLGDWEVVGLGVVFVLLGASASAVQQVFGKLAAAHLLPNVLTFYRAAGGAVVIAVYALATGTLDASGADLSHWIATLVGGFLGPCAGFLFMYRSVRYWDLSRTAIVHSFGPLLVIPLAFLFFHEVPDGQTAVGGCAILVGGFWLGWVHMRLHARSVTAPPPEED